MNQEIISVPVPPVYGAGTFLQLTKAKATDKGKGNLHIKNLVLSQTF